ncbi:MAG: UDP-N-acetylmuramoyl-L-alanine--D-glutamate ligase [Alphaproteobacteria bacterium]|nr:UDP-N-acetylmuramoyl-L-alanine--D-glutamate ligase [Alphaproteobacteria bacterium]
MITLPDLSADTYYVVGLARSGLGAIKALKKAGATLYAWDDQTDAHIEATRLGAKVLPPHKINWQGLKALVLSPGIPHTYPKPHLSAKLALQQDVPIICDMDFLFQAKTDARFLGITGTNGKSTTTALIGHILRKAGFVVEVGGNIGVSALELEDLPEGGIYVLEMSSYQLERVPHLRCEVGVFLNLMPDHLERHGGIEGYIRAKRRLLEGSPPPFMVMGTHEVIMKELFARVSGEAVCVDLNGIPHKGLYVSQDGILTDNYWEKGRSICTLLDLAGKLPGLHNAQNALAAYGAARRLGLTFEDCREGILSFKGLPHRIERLGRVSGITFINDSKATNAEATSKALSAFKDISWIVGGKPKEDGLTGIEPYLGHVRHAYLIGESEEAFAAFLTQHKVPHTKCGTLKHAAARAVEDLKGQEGLILLSPACASFDQFHDYEERGNTFRDVFSQFGQTVAARNAS